ncbi:MAG TPA: hypothetical protein VK522_20570 [Pseudolabrys sp.]|jgi:hypothetical protein|nr:hypothetical protein [Pseudolabrys sp.]
MRSGVKRSFGWLAILVFALHAVLSGVALPAAASTLDPFSVICHSGVQADPADQSPDTPQPVACDHCTLCGAAAAPPLTLDRIAAGQLLPAKLLHMLRPAPAAARDGLSSNPHQARGPPQLT